MSPYIFLSVVLLASSTSAAFRYGKLTGSDRMNTIYPKCQANPCIISYELAPHCASDGKSYPNARSIKCFAKCLKFLGLDEDLRIVHAGYCESDKVLTEKK